MRRPTTTVAVITDQHATAMGAVVGRSYSLVGRVVTIGGPMPTSIITLRIIVATDIHTTLLRDAFPDTISVRVTTDLARSSAVDTWTFFHTCVGVGVNSMACNGSFFHVVPVIMLGRHATHMITRRQSTPTTKHRTL